MDEYDEVYSNYLESGTCTYPEGLSKDGYIIILIMTQLGWFLFKFNAAYGELLPFADEWRSIIWILMEVPLTCNTVKQMGVKQI